jgi:hypothetical protein
MIRERGKGATKEDVARALRAFARAADTRKLHPGNAVVLLRAMSDLHHLLEGVLKAIPELRLDVHTDALMYGGDRVLEGPTRDSIPRILYRDGIRKLAIRRGVTHEELEVLVGAAARGLAFGGLGDDVVSDLWRHDLTHIAYDVVDTTIDAKAEGASSLPNEIESVLGEIDAGKSLETSATDPFQPPAAFIDAPAYREAISTELAAENERAILDRARAVLIDAWRGAKGGDDAKALGSALLEMFDTALVNDDPTLAGSIAKSVAALGEPAGAWLEEASAEPRMRRLVPMMQSRPGKAEEIFAVIEGLGRPALSGLFALLPSLDDAQNRRLLSERIVEIGVDSLDPVKELINKEPAFLAAEGIFILGRVATPEALGAIRDARVHPRIHVRLALVETSRSIPAEIALGILLDMLGKESDPKVLAAVARALVRYKTKETTDALEQASLRVENRQLAFDAKLAILTSYAAVAKERAIPLLAKYVKRGEGLLARKDAEELAASSLRALGGVRSKKASEIFEAAMASRSKLIKETAREVLDQQQGAEP